MEYVRECIDCVAENSKIVIKTTESDYIGENGLVYCGRCRTPKQCEIEMLGERCVVN